MFVFQIASLTGWPRPQTTPMGLELWAPPQLYNCSIISPTKSGRSLKAGRAVASSYLLASSASLTHTNGTILFPALAPLHVPGTHHPLIGNKLSRNRQKRFPSKQTLTKFGMDARPPRAGAAAYWRSDLGGHPTDPNVSRLARAGFRAGSKTGWHRDGGAPLEARHMGSAARGTAPTPPIPSGAGRFKAKERSG